MKKILLAILVIVIAFIALTYFSARSTDKNFETCTIKNLDDLDKLDLKKHDSVLVALSTLYEGNFLKNMMQGENYRKTWAVPVKLPVANLDTLKGGLEVIKKGGGKQTHSLKLLSKDGIMYTLRSVNKDPKKLIPDVAKDLYLENIIVDGISGQHPYGAILAASLANIAEVPHTSPKMYFVPKQNALKKYNDKFGDRIYLLEFETESKKNWTPLPNISGIVETDKLQELKSTLKNRLHIDKAALIRARLFDLLIGDWDRHAEQWGWAIQKNGEKTIAIPIPGDRDNAFFKLDGIIPEIVTNKNIEPLVRPFEMDIDYMPGLVYPFDIYFLKGASEELFVKEAENLQSLLNNRSIDEAFKVWPKEISALDQEEIADKLKNRRVNLVKYAREFHEIIEEQPYLTAALKGSEKLEISESLIKCFECAAEE
ncbi:hypothetical protein [Gramella sp. AN32]|uniref:Uncharacterized protein n=1 Tax=Christiangramia antarctica TaxID=2058158 RepID=A0ABW5X7F2_9FLAO|nr:hypothetical protein [Gramella sp. AN32]MCM4154489.1 hypothetical protein [Gramella sp. AN32]